MNQSSRIVAAVAYGVMVGMNGLANALPINGVTTGEVSDSYSNLFTPAGFTFGIWAVIYGLLGGYTLYQLGAGRRDSESIDRTIDSITWPFIATSLLNAAWIVCWHYGILWLSVIVMVAILVLLIAIALTLTSAFQTTSGLQAQDYLLIRAPFSVYFGWITVATVANITTLLVSEGWRGSVLSEQAWTVIVLVVAGAIGVATTLRIRDAAYGLVFVWAYYGILAEHRSARGWNRAYDAVIYSLYGLLAVFVAVCGYVVLTRPASGRPANTGP